MSFRKRQIPQQADAIVIGGGIIGCATALWLARAGMRPVLCEKGRIGGEQSGRNWGWIRRIGRDPAELPLARRAMELWRQMPRLAGTDPGFVPCGIAYLCRNEEELERRHLWLKANRDAAGEDIRLLSGRETAELFPGAAVSFTGALHAPHDGRAEPLTATRAIAEAAKRAGVILLENCAVRDITLQGGAIHGVQTERGEIRTGTVVLAGGIWSRMLCDRLGLRLPQLGVINSVQYTAPLDGAPETSAGEGDCAFRRTVEGGYAIAHWRLSETIVTPQHLRFTRDFLPALKESWKDLPPRPTSPFQPWARSASWNTDGKTPFEEVRVLDPPPSTRILRKALKALQRDFPAFAKARIVRRQAGVIDVLPDVLPVIDSPAEVPGLVIATGFSGHGFGIGPAAGEAAAALAAGKSPLTDISAFTLARFR